MSGVTTKKFSPLDQPEHLPLATPIFKGTSKGNTCKFTEWSYLSPRAKIKKIKGTSFPSTFKV